MKDIGRNKGGFSLIELIVALVISSIILTGIYSVYTTNQKVFATQQQVVEMEQNLRAANFMLVNDLRMAGYDPTGDAGAGIVTGGTNTITITMDLDDDDAFTSPSENITYALADPDSVGRESLYRYSSAPPNGDDMIADNIDALDFVYLDGDSNVMEMTVALPATVVSPADVRSIQISIEARTAHSAPGGTFQRRTLTSWIKCRNLGL